MNCYTFRPGRNGQVAPFGGGGNFDTVSSNRLWICCITLHHVQCSGGRPQGMSLWAVACPPEPSQSWFSEQLPGLAFLVVMFFSVGQRQLENNTIFITVPLLSGSIFGWGTCFGGNSNFVQFWHNGQSPFLTIFWPLIITLHALTPPPQS